MADLHLGHRSRMRERFTRDDLDGFEPHAVLELLLYYTISRADTNPIAHRLIDRFGSLHGVLDAPYDELVKVEGIGPSSAVLLKMIPSLSRRYLSDKFADGVVLDTPKKLGEYICPRFIGINRERFYLVCMDRKRKLLGCRVMMEGSIDSVSVDLRAIVETVVHHSASVVALAHNHTQGFALPSNADLAVTRRIVDALRPISVEVVDHIIVARDDFVSLADSGFFLRSQ